MQVQVYVIEGKQVSILSTFTAQEYQAFLTNSKIAKVNGKMSYDELCDVARQYIAAVRRDCGLKKLKAPPMSVRQLVW